MRFLIYYFLLITAIDCFGHNMEQGQMSSPGKLELIKDYNQLKIVAEQGDIQSQYKLFMLAYQNQPHLNEYVNEAFQYLIKAGLAEYTEAQFIIGSLYQTGMVVKKSADTALTWLTEAANKGHATAQYLVGSNYKVRYLENRSAAQADEHYSNAAKWFSQAVKAGVTEAKRELGVLLLIKDNDSIEGNELLMAAALSGDARAMYFIAIGLKHKWYKSGKADDLEQAKAWLKKSIEAGHQVSQGELDKLIAEEKH